MTEDIITPIEDKEALHPNMLKCINCGESAEFHVNGNRVCSDEVCVGKYCYKISLRERGPLGLDDTIWRLEKELEYLQTNYPITRGSRIIHVRYTLDELYEQQTRRDLEFLQEE